jgi:hypothetical protein
MTALFDAYDLLNQGTACLEESADADHPGVRSNALAEARRLWGQAQQVAPEETLGAALQALRDSLDAVELMELGRGHGRALECREKALGALARAETCKAAWSDPRRGKSGLYVTPRVITAVRAWINETARRVGLQTVAVGPPCADSSPPSGEQTELRPATDTFVPIQDYSVVDFSERGAAGETALSIVSAAHRSDVFMRFAMGPERAVIWAVPSKLPSALYLSDGAMAAAALADVSVGPTRRVWAADVPADRALLLGDIQDWKHAGSGEKGSGIQKRP